MERRWPRAVFVEDEAATAPLAARAFDPKCRTPMRRCASS